MPSPTEIREKLLVLRTTVGFLGERDQFAWWDTSFLSATGQRFLAITFPRTAAAAGIHSVSEAARKVHDQHIGTARRVYHLFRLPPHLERELADVLSSGGDALEGNMPSSQDEAMNTLAALANGNGRQAVGPTGLDVTFTYEGIIAELATHYHAAFASGERVYPYVKGQH